MLIVLFLYSKEDTKHEQDVYKRQVETDRFMQQLKKEGREQYSIGEYVEKVYNPVSYTHLSFSTYLREK